MTARIIEQTMTDPWAFIDADPPEDPWAHIGRRD